ncbi:MAG: hypothetical protein ACT4P7_13480 [Gemmatimonadaceae bacterium]
MLHLPIERFAELVDGTPTPLEREHVASCARCAAELARYRRVVAMANDERRRIGPPLTSWESLRPGLQDEGLLVDPRLPLRRRSRATQWTQRAAAVALLLAGGAVVGRVSTGLSFAESIALGSSGMPTVNEEGIAAALVSNTGSLRTAQDALEQLERAQRDYEEAAAFLAAHDTSSSSGASDQYRTRLAALDMASETFEQALTDAPEDPIINQYYMATMNAREVAIRRLGTTLPASLRMGRF